MNIQLVSSCALFWFAFISGNTREFTCFYGFSPYLFLLLMLSHFRFYWLILLIGPLFLRSYLYANIIQILFGWCLPLCSERLAADYIHTLTACNPIHLPQRRSTTSDFASVWRMKDAEIERTVEEREREGGGGVKKREKYRIRGKQKEKKNRQQAIDD